MQNSTEVQIEPGSASTDNNALEQFPHQIIHRDKQGRLIIHIPMNLKKRGGRKEIVLPHNSHDNDQPKHSTINKPLAIAVALGHRWLELMTGGQYNSVGELAEDVGIDPSQLRRHLSLTCLPPKLVRAILDGKEPDGVSLEKLKEGAQHDDYPNFIQSITP